MYKLIITYRNGKQEIKAYSDMHSANMALVEVVKQGNDDIFSVKVDRG